MACRLSCVKLAVFLSYSDDGWLLAIMPPMLLNFLLFSSLYYPDLKATRTGAAQNKVQQGVNSVNASHPF